MKKNYFLGLILLISGFTVKAQDTISFESFGLPLDTAVNRVNMGAGGGAGIFKAPATMGTDSLHVGNFYDTSFGGLWSGFSVSTMTDTLTPGFMNEYSSIAGSGFNNSLTYLTYYQGYQGTNKDYGLSINNSGTAIDGFYVNNSTYAYLSMRDGDGIGKMFGDTTGGSDGKDWFKLRITGSNTNDSVTFYLADFRSSDTNDHYILKEWTFVDVSSLGYNDSLFFSLTSSDVGGFGMNTPSYFCLDQVVISSQSASVAQVSLLELNVYPNPTTDYINLSIEDQLTDATIQIVSTNGQTVNQTNATITNQTTIDVSNLPKGSYILNLISKGKVFKQQFIKN